MWEDPPASSLPSGGGGWGSRSERGGLERTLPRHAEKKGVPFLPGDLGGQSGGGNGQGLLNDKGRRGLSPAHLLLPSGP